MMYAYDLFFNWSDEEPYEFYEWEERDILEHIKKVPVIRVTNESFLSLLKDDITVCKDLLDKIYNKTITSANKFLAYTALFTNGFECIGVEFNKDGKILMRSKLFFDEIEEIVNVSKDLEITNFKYKVLKRKNNHPFLTRKERNIKNYLIKEFNKIKYDQDKEKLKYLYYEWYNKVSDNFDYMYNRLRKNINQDFTKKHFDLYELIKLSYIKK